jgi:hypothetical protein
LTHQSIDDVKSGAIGLEGIGVIEALINVRLLVLDSGDSKLATFFKIEWISIQGENRAVPQARRCGGFGGCSMWASTTALTLCVETFFASVEALESLRLMFKPP